MNPSPFPSQQLRVRALLPRRVVQASERGRLRRRGAGLQGGDPHGARERGTPPCQVSPEAFFLKKKYLNSKNTKG